MTEKILCDIYKSLKKDEMYLYVNKLEGLSRVPQPLLDSMGKLAQVTTLALTAERKLARAEAGKVLESIRHNGFYLQMPPTRDELIDAPMKELNLRNEKLPR